MRIAYNLLLFAMVFYFVGATIWLSRQRTLSREHIFLPWQKARDKEDFAACYYFSAVYRNYSLLGAQYCFNPIMWIRHWNWRPPEFVSAEFPAGTYKEGDEFDIH